MWLDAGAIVIADPVKPVAKVLLEPKLVRTFVALWSVLITPLAWRMITEPTVNVGMAMLAIQTIGKVVQRP